MEETTQQGLEDTVISTWLRGERKGHDLPGEETQGRRKEGKTNQCLLVDRCLPVTFP